MTLFKKCVFLFYLTISDSLTFNSGVKWSKNAADYRNMELEESREVLRGKISTAFEKIRFDLYIIAMGEFREATRLVRTPISFSTSLF